MNRVLKQIKFTSKLHIKVNGIFILDLILTDYQQNAQQIINSKDSRTNVNHFIKFLKSNSIPNHRPTAVKTSGKTLNSDKYLAF